MSKFNFEAAFDEMTNEIKTLRKSIQDRSTELLKQVFNEFFKEHPGVTAFGWHQYTPYFNDGDPCVFGSSISWGWATNCPDLENLDRYGQWVGEDDAPEVWVDNPDYGDYNADIVAKDLRVALDKLRRLLGKIDDDVLLNLFGDHVVVVATRKGFEVEEFDHD